RSLTLVYVSTYPQPKGKHHGKCATAGDDPIQHRHRHRPHDRPGGARRVRRRGHHVLAVPGRRRAPAGADAATAGEGLPAARPDRRVVHHRRRPRDVLRVRQPAALRRSQVRPCNSPYRTGTAMNFNLTLIMQAVAFTAFIWFCARFIWPPLMRAIETRQKQIADGLAAGEQGRKELAQAEKRDAEMLAEAKARSAEIVAIGEKFKAETIEQAKIDAKTEADRILVAAKAEIQQEFARAKEQLR